MTEFRIVIDNPFGTDTYENTKKTYEWVVRTLKASHLAWLGVRMNCEFNTDKISCYCTGIRNFTEQAYQQGSYHFSAMWIAPHSVFRRKVISVTVQENAVVITTKNKEMLERFTTALKENETRDTVSNGNTLKDWCTAIAQSIVSNAVWILLTALGTSLAALLLA